MSLASPTRKFGLDELELALRNHGRIMVAGPVNVAYELRIDGETFFVRKRIVDDDEYGQQFAAERYAVEIVGSALRMPRLIQVVSDQIGRERYALFEFIAGEEPDWSRSENLTALAGVLATIHSVPGPGLGNITSELQATSVREYLCDLLLREASRLSHRRDVARGAVEQAKALTMFEDERPCLCHGDIHRGNFLTDTNNRLWVLDWEACRYRVAASDFNQLQVGWLNDADEAFVLTEYNRFTGRELPLLTTQIRILRLLWHIRTFNFHVNVLGRSAAACAHELTAADELLQSLDDDGARQPRVPRRTI